MDRKSQLTALILFVGLLLVATVGLVGCESGTAASPESSTLITLISQPVDFTWTPAESPSSADQARIADVLRSHDLHILLPSIPPVADAATVSARFILWETVPTKEITLELVVTRGDEANPLIAVQSWVGNPSEGAAETRAVQIRGRDGQARVSPGTVSMLDWQEGGQNYHAEWVGLPLGQVVAWLEAWRTLP